MKRIIWNELTPDQQRDVLARPEQRTGTAIMAAVEEIFDAVRNDGADAVAAYSMQFDGAPPEGVVLSEGLVAECRESLQQEDISALEFAADNITRYHEATRPKDVETELSIGVRCRQVYRPLRSVGVYAPGGSAMLVSSLLMTAIPASIAGVDRIVAVTPPCMNEEGRRLMIFAASLCGVEKLHFVGGAQAIAALTYGAGAISKVDKIVGPGGVYVSAAKMYASALPDGPAIDLPAGPSELMVIAASGAANPQVIAADLLSQAEHDSSAQVVFVTTELELAEKVSSAVSKQLAGLPRRRIAECALENSLVIIVDDLQTALGIANDYAPEHLSIVADSADMLANEVRTAGAVFLGSASAEVFSDYVCGPSHVLPTDGAGRAWSGLSTASFMRAISIQEISERGAELLAPHAARIARLEGLEAHARAALIRVRPLNNSKAPV